MVLGWLITWPIMIFSIKHYKTVLQNHEPLTVGDFVMSFAIAIIPFANITLCVFFYTVFNDYDFTVQPRKLS